MPKSQRGISIVMMAFLLPVILIIFGLAIDLGMAYAARTLAQNAADAGALAGAYSYLNNPTSPTPVDDAVAVTNQNYIFKDAIAITADNVSLPTTGTCATSHCVTVTIPFTSQTYFAKLFGWNSISMTVNATAQSGGGGGVGTYCSKPIFIASGGTSLGAKGKCDPSLSDPVINASTAPGTVIPDIRPTDPKCALTPGVYYSLDFGKYMTTGNVTFSDGTSDAGNGANTYEDALAKCTTIVFKCGEYPIKTGAMPVPTGRGITEAGYTAPWTGLGDYGDSLATAPVWDSSQPLHKCIDPAYGGADCVNVIGFARIFIDAYDDKNGNTPIAAHFISFSDCSGGGGGSVSGPSGAPIRLVKTP